MKALILKLLLGCTLPVGMFGTMFSGMFPPEKPVNKEISFSVSGDSSYSQCAYNNAKAAVRVMIFKITGNKAKMVWDKCYDTLPLNQYTLAASPVSQHIRIGGVMESREKLVVKYVVTYSAKNSIMEMVNEEVINKGAKHNKLVIEI